MSTLLASLSIFAHRTGQAKILSDTGGAPHHPTPVPTRTTTLPSPFGPQQAPGSVSTSLQASTQHGWMDSVLLVLKAASWPLPGKSLLPLEMPGPTLYPPDRASLGQGPSLPLQALGYQGSPSEVWVV